MNIPDRRPCVTEDVGDFAVTVGYHPDSGQACEIFISKRAKTGTVLEENQYNIGVTASKLMQAEYESDPIHGPM
jgi:hypothetical protein